jgi:hypothetical protein
MIGPTNYLENDELLVPLKEKDKMMQKIRKYPRI